MALMNADQPTEGRKGAYGNKETHHLRLRMGNKTTPVIIFVHGDSWQLGPRLDSISSTKVVHLPGFGYAIATVNYSLVPSVTVEQEKQEVADSVGFLSNNVSRLNIDGERVILMGHSSGAHVVTFLGANSKRGGVSIHSVRGVIALGGSNYNTLAEVLESPGAVAQNMIYALGNDPEWPPCSSHRRTAARSCRQSAG